jgi:hypothetical protein
MKGRLHIIGGLSKWVIFLKVEIDVVNKCSCLITVFFVEIYGMRRELNYE